MKAYRKPPRTTDDAIERAFDEMWPRTWPKPSEFWRRWILIFARKVVRDAEEAILNRVDVPRWSEFDRETIN